jgi:hypothetical protein
LQIRTECFFTARTQTPPLKKLSWVGHPSPFAAKSFRFFFCNHFGFRGTYCRDADAGRTLILTGTWGKDVFVVTSYRDVPAGK